MTVQELIDALSKIEDKSLIVIGEGCDCDNPVKSVKEDYLDGEVLIEVRI